MPTAKSRGLLHLQGGAFHRGLASERRPIDDVEAEFRYLAPEQDGTVPWFVLLHLWPPFFALPKRPRLASHVSTPKMEEFVICEFEAELASCAPALAAMIIATGAAFGNRPGAVPGAGCVDLVAVSREMASFRPPAIRLPPRYARFVPFQNVAGSQSAQLVVILAGPSAGGSSCRATTPWLTSDQ
jgi:hypothetical protein